MTVAIVWFLVLLYGLVLEGKPARLSPRSGGRGRRKVDESVARTLFLQEAPPLYNVVVLSEPLPARANHRLITVVHPLGGEKFACQVPSSPAANSNDDDATTEDDDATTEDENDVGNPATTPTEKEEVELAQSMLATAMADHPCLYLNAGWWTYSVCMSGELRQFHRQSPTDVEGAEGARFTLGLRKMSTLQPRLTDQYYSEQWVNGSLCDLSGRPRTAEIRFECPVVSSGQESAGAQRPSLISVEELKSCTYLVSVSAPGLCGHPRFKPVADVIAESIDCVYTGSNEQVKQAILFVTSKNGKATFDDYTEEMYGEVDDIEETEDDGDDDLAASLLKRRAWEQRTTEHRPVEQFKPSGVLPAIVFPPRNRRPESVRFVVGQVYLHKLYKYRAVIVGWDTECAESEAWIQEMGVDQLKRGRKQPFYYSLVDSSDRHPPQLTYVAQENIELLSNARDIKHPDLSSYFIGRTAHLYTMAPAVAAAYIPDSHLADAMQARSQRAAKAAKENKNEL